MPAYEPEDWFGHLFRVMRSAGLWVNMTYVHLRPGESPEWFYIPHDEMDGLSGLVMLLRKKGLDPEPLPTINKRWSEWQAITESPLARTPAAQWKMFDHVSRTVAEGIPSARASALLSEAETDRVRQRARRSRATVSMLMLWTLSRAVAAFLDLRSGPIIWEIPINVRGAVQLPNEEANHVSMMAVPVAIERAVRDLQESLLAMLDAGQHWVTWNLNAKAGRAGLDALRARVKLMDRFAGFRVGIFTAGGEWLDGQRGEQYGGWAGSAPPLISAPLATGAVTVHGRLGLLLNAHPRLTRDPALAESWMEAWRAELLAE